MARSRKTNRVPVQASAFDDAISITSAGSTSTVPPHRRQSSITSTPTANERAAAKPAPHLRALSSHPAPPEETIASPTRPKAAESAPPPPKETPPTNFARNNPYACTFPGCKRVFKSLGLLKQHKASDDAGHDYCKVCDLDFEDDDALHMHKIGSEKHICCEVCSEDFSSESGRDRHMRQMHVTSQNICCRGCGKKFLKGAALVQHIERNQCPHINRADFETQRALVAVNMHKISNMDTDDAGLLSFAASTAGDQSVGGGVPVEAESLLDNEEAVENLNMNMPSLAKVLSSSSSAMSAATVAGNKAYDASYPALGSEPKPKGKGKEKAGAGKENVSQGATWAQQHFPDAPKTPAPADWQQVSSSETGIVSTVDPLTGQKGHFRIMDLKRNPLDSNFHCPFDQCKSGPYPTLELVAEHLRSGVHKGVEHHCVGCLRRFKTSAALTAHMESSSERCNVRETKQFGNALSLVSGGYLGVAGRHADGSIKIDAPHRPLPQW